MWVAPFGYLRIYACLPLPAAFRSLPRPSSASGAKAFPLRPFLLNLFFGHYVGSLLKKLFSLAPQNCSISTQTFSSSDFHTFLSCSVASCFVCIVQFSRYISLGHRPFALSGLVGSNGLEPSTSRLSGARSNRLSYEPIFNTASADLQN